VKHRAAIIGLLAGALAVVLLLVYLNRVEQEAAGGRKIPVIVAVEEIRRGIPISESMLGTREIPVAYVDDRVVRVNEKEKILGLRATSTIPVQQSLIWNDVMAISDDRRSLSSLVQPGNRATPVRVQMTDALALIHPGDFVDILCVCGTAKESSVLLQRVLVLATGTTTSAASSSKDTERQVSVLTLSTSLQESQLLSVAMENGKLTAVVRNPSDQRVTDSPADVSAESVTDATRRQAIQNPRRAARTAPIELKDQYQ